MTNGGFSNLGGLSGADTKCQFAANDAKLGGTWKAWLSDGTTSAASRLTHNSGPYKLVNGTVVANNWADLTDGSIQHPINITEYSRPVMSSGSVWTNTSRDGNLYNIPGYGINHCQGWTSNSMNDKGGIGSTAATGQGWTESGYSYCSSVLPLYCVEQ